MPGSPTRHISKLANWRSAAPGDRILEYIIGDGQVRTEALPKMRSAHPGNATAPMAGIPGPTRRGSRTGGDQSALRLRTFAARTLAGSRRTVPATAHLISVGLAGEIRLLTRRQFGSLFGDTHLLHCCRIQSRYGASFPYQGAEG
ncbi:hypothetical protein GCM10009525_74210 [Streptosporangium amethystogenes subsp. fukuiense]